MAAKADTSRTTPGFSTAGVGWRVGTWTAPLDAARHVGSQHHNAGRERAPITATGRIEKPAKSETDYTDRDERRRSHYTPRMARSPPLLASAPDLNNSQKRPEEGQHPGWRSGMTKVVVSESIHPRPQLGRYAVEGSIERDDRRNGDSARVSGSCSRLSLS